MTLSLTIDEFLQLMGVRGHILEIDGQLDELLEQGSMFMKELEDLQLEVARDTTVIQSATTLIQGIADRIAAAGVDPTALNNLRMTLQSQVNDLATAVTQNTPASQNPA